MIIVSQDKDMIINFDRVECIDIVADLDGTGKIPHIISYETNSKREELGRYKTEERAEEVLQEIIKTYKKVMTTINRERGQQKFYDLPKVYYMPEK